MNGNGSFPTMLVSILHNTQSVAPNIAWLQLLETYCPHIPLSRTAIHLCIEAHSSCLCRCHFTLPTPSSDITVAHILQRLRKIQLLLESERNWGCTSQPYSPTDILSKAGQQPGIGDMFMQTTELTHNSGFSGVNPSCTSPRHWLQLLNSRFIHFVRWFKELHNVDGM